jgi:hypothetical protein
MTYRDIHGNELKAGDRIRMRDGSTRTLYARTYALGSGIKEAAYGGRTRLCMGDSVSEPAPESYVREMGIEKI